MRIILDVIIKYLEAYAIFHGNSRLAIIVNLVFLNVQSLEKPSQNP